MKEETNTSGFSAEKLLSDLDKCTTDLLQTISMFSPRQFNAIPFEGSWSAGQVAEHLLKSESGLPSLFQGNTKQPNRPVDEKMETIRSTFLDFESKFESPDFIRPSAEPKNQEIILEAFGKSRKEINRVIGITDMSNCFTDFPFPQMGIFTGWEWIYFLTCHSIRHTRQMKNIYSILSKK